MKDIEKIIEKNFTRVEKYEIKEIKYRYIKEHNILIVLFVNYLIKYIEEISILQEVKEYKLDILYGEYMEKNISLLKIRNEENIVWTDIISNPNFFVSEKVKEVINKYDNKIKFKQVILLDIIGAKAELYYLPILKFIKCLSEES